MLTSYKNDPKLKKMLLSEIVRHRKMDAIVKGTYGSESQKEFKGCAVGCSIHSLNLKLGKTYSTADHSVYEKELGIPEWLARLEDTLFESLPAEEAKLWPERFTKAIPVGVNLEPVKWKFCTFLIKENIDRVLNLKDISDELKKEVVDALRGVLSLHETSVETGIEARSAAESAESAAWSAWSAWSARSAAWSAWSARSAAWSAAWSARSAARSAAYQKYAKELLRLLKAAK